MAQASVVTRTMRDTAVKLEAISVPQTSDPFIIRQPQHPYCHCLRDPGPARRIGVSVRPLMDAPVDPEIAATVLATARMLQQLGHHVEKAAPDFDLVEMEKMLKELWYFQFDRYLDWLGERSGRKVGPDTVERASLAFYEFAKGRSVDAHLKALDDLKAFRRRIGKFYDRFDMWLTPTCAQVAQPNELYGMDVDVPASAFLERRQRPCQFMVWVNVAGVPAISLPLGQHSTGLPIGVQLAARPGHEEQLIAVGAQLEHAMPWRDRLPPTHVSRIL